jgi:hypothetical protein
VKQSDAVGEDEDVKSLLTSLSKCESIHIRLLRFPHTRKRDTMSCLESSGRLTEEVFRNLPVGSVSWRSRQKIIQSIIATPASHKGGVR